jgi:hypothetical protein
MTFDLSSIKRGRAIDPPRIVIYGPHGVGKTTLLSEAPAPILLPTEEGVGQLDIARFPVAKTYAEVTQAIGSVLNGEHEFGTFGIDSIDWLEPIVWAETCARNSWKDIEQPGFGKGYIAADDVWRELFQGLSALRSERNMQVMLLAHAQVKQFNDPSSDPYDRYSPKLQARANAIVQEWADMVGFLNHRTYTQKTKTGIDKFITRGVGLGERILYTEERPSHLAKNRYNLPPELPLPKGQAYAALSAHLFPQPTH